MNEEKFTQSQSIKTCSDKYIHDIGQILIYFAKRITYIIRSKHFKGMVQSNLILQSFLCFCRIKRCLIISRVNEIERIGMDQLVRKM